jgi:DNA-binding NtrC family response regulator
VEDIVLLFGYFLEKMDKKLGRVFCIQPEVIERIACYDWPGNVRELQNVVERIISLTEDQNISLAQLPTEFNPIAVPAPQAVLPLVVKIAGDRQERRRRVAESERQEIMLLLNEHGGNISVTAQQLGISRNTLYRKMRLYDIKN